MSFGGWSIFLPNLVNKVIIDFRTLVFKERINGLKDCLDNGLGGGSDSLSLSDKPFVRHINYK